MKKYYRFPLAITLIVGLVAGMACAKTSEGKTVKVGLSTCLTGAVAALMEDSNAGFIDYIDYINDEFGGIEYTAPEGGVDHVKIDLQVEDSTYSTAKTISIYKRQKADGVMAMAIVGTTMAEAVADMCSRDEICLFPVWTYASPTLWAPTPLFSAGNYDTACSCTLACFEWFKDEWEEAGKTGTPKVGQLRLDTAGSRAGGEAVPDYVDDVGVELVGTEYAPVNVTDLSLELQRLVIDGEATCVAHGMASPFVIGKSATLLGIDFDEVAIISDAGCISESFIEMEPDLLEGQYALTQVALPSETDLAGVQKGIEVCQKYQGDDPTLAYLVGILQGMQLCDVIKLALEKVGYDDLTGEAINYELHHLTDWESGGLHPTVTVDPDAPVTLPHCKVTRVEDGKFVSVSDWYEYIPSMRE